MPTPFPNPRPTSQPRKRRRRPWVIALALAILIFIGYGSENGGPNLSNEPAATTGSAIAPVVPVVVPVPDPARERVTVLRVIDGDTFKLSDDRTVRVLGIDSCEMDSTAGEDAKRYAESLLATSVTLAAEPGADKDRNGRLLRYVTLTTGSDFGTQMVMYDHTGVYQGRHDASAEYVQRLYAADTEYAANPPAGRSCPPRPVVVQPNNGGYHDHASDDDTVRSPRTGNTGHPCLPGERDGDGDGYCKEGR